MYVEVDFHLVSELPSNRYLDLVSNNAVIKTPNGFPSQVFYFDYKTKTIKSRRSTNMSLDIRTVSSLIVAGTNSAHYQVFKYENNMLRNLHNNRVIDVTGSKDEEGAATSSDTIKNSAN